MAAIAQLLRQREAQARVARLLRGEAPPSSYSPSSEQEESGSSTVNASAMPSSLAAHSSSTAYSAPSGEVGDVVNESPVRFQPPRRSLSVDSVRERMRVNSVGGAALTFVVEAVQPKRRPPPLKPVSESRDEVMRRERQGRRAAALERLAARRERRGRAIEVRDRLTQSLSSLTRILAAAGQAEGAEGSSGAAR